MFYNLVLFSSYGHFEVTELLIRHGANVGALDLWQFSPLHEAASKGRTEVCSLLLSHGADPTTVNCHGKSAIDVAASQELKDALSLEFRGLRPGIFFVRFIKRSRPNKSA